MRINHVLMVSWGSKVGICLCVGTCLHEWDLGPHVEPTLRATLHRDWEHVTITLQALSLVEKVEPIQICFTLHLRDQGNMWMQHGYKLHMGSWMASDWSCFMVTWTIFKNHLLEVGLTQNLETMVIRTLITVNLFYFYYVWGPAWIEIHWDCIWLRPIHIWIHSICPWWSATALHDPGGVLGQPLDTFF